MDVIDVIIPVYNAQNYLDRCISSVLAQSYSNIRLIIIDDGSTDDSGTICDKYAALDNRVRVVHKRNTGVSDSRNVGLDIAEGEFVGFVDSDDYIEPNMYEKLYASIIENEADICCCGYIEENDTSEESSKKSAGKTIVYESVSDAYRELFGHNGCMGNGNWNKLFRRSVIEKNRFKNYAVGEDVEFQIRCFHNARKIVCTDECLYHYVHNDGNVTGKAFRKQSMDMIYAIDEGLDFIKKNQPDVLKEMYAYHLMWYMATVQVMYWAKSTKPFKKEKMIIRESLLKNMPYYKHNDAVYKLDKIFLKAYIYHFFRPVYSLFKLYKRV